MNLVLRAAGALLATSLCLPAGAADAPASAPSSAAVAPAQPSASAPASAASAAAPRCAGPGADRTANQACAVELERRAQAEAATGHPTDALATAGRAVAFAPDDLRFAMGQASLRLKIAGQLTPAGIEAAAAATPNDVGVTMLHAELALARKDFPRVLSDLDRVIAQRPDAPLAWEMRASANVARPDFAAARGDTEHALRLDPKSAASLRLRAILRNNAGDYAGAIADYQAAHALGARPEDPLLIGSTQFLARRYADAGASLARGAPPAPDGTYWRLWRYMALARLDGPLRASGSLGPGTPAGVRVSWPVPVVDYFLGRIDSATLLSIAKRSQEASDLSQVCEAHFYMAEDSLLHQRDDAVDLLRRALKECPVNFHEYEGAQAELTAMGLPLAAPALAVTTTATAAAPAASAPASTPAP